MAIPRAALPLRRGARGLAVNAAQLLLAAHGHAVAPDGAFGPATERAVRAFQAAAGLTVDGVIGETTATRLEALPSPSGAPVAPAAPAPVVLPPEAVAGRLVPPHWLPALPRGAVKGVVVHWTAGAYNPTTFDRGHYHVLFDGAGRAIRGVPSITQNCPRSVQGYAAHTLGANGGRIGVSMAAMGVLQGDPQVTERNFGRFPLKREQWDAMTTGVAEILQRYGLPVREDTACTHAEAPRNLGKPQRGKWDVTVLPFEGKAVLGAKVVGDRMRAEIASKLARLAA